MKKGTLQKLTDNGWDSIRNVAKAIRELTAENPLILFTKEQAENEEVEIYDLPYGYNVDKYSTYQQGAVMEVQGSDVKLFLTGDEFGQIWESELEHVPFECQLQILQILIEKL